MKKIIGNLWLFFVTLFSRRNVYFFTDCRDSNAISRVLAHLNAQLPFFNHYLFPLQNFSWQEAAVNIVSLLEVWITTGVKGNIVVGNIAPRQDKNWKNGSPFCFVWVEGNLIVATPACFSVLIKKGLVKEDNIHETDVFEVCSKYLSKQKAEKVATTQFRSLWYVPLLLRWIVLGKKVPFKQLKSGLFDFLKNIEWSVFFVDNFSNLKFLETASDFERIKSVKSHFMVKDRSETYPIKFRERLSDVPDDGFPYFILGSSDDQVELVIQGKEAGKILGLDIGGEINFLSV